MVEVIDLYAYCLMPNHFHFLIKVKSREDLETFVKVSNFDKCTASKMNYEHYVFSSYFSIVLKSKSNIRRKEVLTLSEDTDNFKYVHQYPPKFDFKF